MNFRNELHGKCHCGNISFTLRTNKFENEFIPRICQCTLCRKHDASYISDPDGVLDISFNSAITNKYRFGHSTSDFIICKECGVLTMALCDFNQGTRAVINIKSMNDYKFAESIQTVFDEESVESRLERRSKTWIGTVNVVNL